MQLYIEIYFIIPPCYFIVCFWFCCLHVFWLPYLVRSLPIQIWQKDCSTSKRNLKTSV